MSPVFGECCCIFLCDIDKTDSAVDLGESQPCVFRSKYCFYSGFVGNFISLVSQQQVELTWTGSSNWKVGRIPKESRPALPGKGFAVLI